MGLPATSRDTLVGRDSDQPLSSSPFRPRYATLAFITDGSHNHHNIQAGRGAGNGKQK